MALLCSFTGHNEKKQHTQLEVRLFVHMPCTLFGDPVLPPARMHSAFSSGGSYLSTFFGVFSPTLCYEAVGRGCCHKTYAICLPTTFPPQYFFSILKPQTSMCLIGNFNRPTQRSGKDTWLYFLLLLFSSRAIHGIYNQPHLI